MGLLKQFQKDRLGVSVYQNRRELGKAAAEDVANQINLILQEKPFVNVVFAAAPSQNELLDELCQMKVKWSQVNAFHMDEYIGLEKDSPQSFASYLQEHLFTKLPFHKVHYLSEYQERYESLIQSNPIDLVCMGIGENGHIAFNDPGEADFYDSKLLKQVQLDPICRQQQVNDGCFSSLDQVPRSAYTLTVPALFGAEHMFCVVPGENKRNAVMKTLYDPINEQCPATILRRHHHAMLYCDMDSGADLLHKEEMSYDSNYSTI